MGSRSKMGLEPGLHARFLEGFVSNPLANEVIPNRPCEQPTREYPTGGVIGVTAKPG
jgi:hypothetical protein